jgi:hypothetical protein
LDRSEWPSVADTCRELNVVQSRVAELIRTGRLRIYRTRVGILVDPESIARYAAERKPRPRRSA